LVEVPAGVVVRRFPNNPIITPDMLSGADGGNINGPSLIRVPEWLPRPLGKYYLYFAHHAGNHIRLAFADKPEGPWTIHPGGSLRLADAPGCRDHIASPDVHVDHARRDIRMFFHGAVASGEGQKTFMARSTDGLRFSAGRDPVAEFYLRVVPWREEHIGMAFGGLTYMVRPGRSHLAFQRLQNRVLPGSHDGPNGIELVRHVALQVRGDVLRIFYSRIGDSPESIRLASVDLGGDPEAWTARDDQLLLAPETNWEGADLPATVSGFGDAPSREKAVRDPAIYEEDGRTYLLYSVAGECGIAIAEVIDP
jgi:hypothetical protein